MFASEISILSFRDVRLILGYYLGSLYSRWTILGTASH